MRTLAITPLRAAILAGVASAALAAAPSAMAATPLTGESFSGSGSAGISGHCTFPGNFWGSASFSVAGTAVGPYPGTFTETGGYSFYSVGGKQPYSLRFHASFTITSGTNTIAGSLSFGFPGAWIVTGCPGATFTGLPVSYTAAIAGQTYQGTAKASVSAEGATASVTENFTG